MTDTRRQTAPKIVIVGGSARMALGNGFSSVSGKKEQKGSA